MFCLHSWNQCSGCAEVNPDGSSPPLCRIGGRPRCPAGVQTARCRPRPAPRPPRLWWPGRGSLCRIHGGLRRGRRQYNCPNACPTCGNSSGHLERTLRQKEGCDFGRAAEISWQDKHPPPPSLPPLLSGMELWDPRTGNNQEQKLYNTGNRKRLGRCTLYNFQDL